MERMNGSQVEGGLSQAEVAARRARDGWNEIAAEKPHTLLATVLDVAREPMFLLLLGAGTIYLLMGDLHEALVLLGFVMLIIAVTVFQERRTEHALAALRDLSSPRALVIRDGVVQRIAGREVVCGDLLLLTEGDRVPADGVMLSANDFAVDESMLSGESEPVSKLPVAWARRPNSGASASRWPVPAAALRRCSANWAGWRAGWRWWASRCACCWRWPTRRCAAAGWKVCCTASRWR